MASKSLSSAWARADFDGRSDLVGILLHADDQGRIHQPGQDGQVAEPDGRAAGGAGCFHRRAFQAAQASLVRQQRPEVCLVRDGRRQHVADIDRLRLQPARV